MRTLEHAASLSLSVILFSYLFLWQNSFILSFISATVEYVESSKPALLCATSGS